MIILLIKSLGFFSNEQSNTYFLSCTAIKCINNLRNQNVPKMFELNLSISSTRNSIIIPRARTGYMYYTILYKSSKIWIKLPEKIKNSKTFQGFKKSIKEMILNNEI